MIDPLKAADKAIEVFDDSTYSREEAEKDRSERLKIDMQADNKLAKIIRPLTTLVLLINNVILSWLVIAMLYFKIDATGARDILITNAGLLATALSWYFYSRRNEKITEKKVMASIKLEQEKTKQERIRERRQYKLEKKK